MSDRHLQQSYEEQVYAGVLGKIIGVYMGRPFEGWSKDRIEEKWGQIDRYVNEDVGHDLVVADDDITGTFTFVRALEDSGKYADTSAEDFGECWMNYLIEGKTILWWGGMGHSTEHTAYLRMKNGIKPPQSGSCALNGKTVAEQIGAQIFIDAIGMCFPGEAERAARVAAEAARVSHDGEAVYAAQIVASMVAMAFVEKDLNKVLDHCITLIPQDSLIAELHKNVRAWAAADGDWRKTFERIDEHYGYHKYGGNCHVIPNHAIMVMAWAYAPDNFHQSQIIINTAGWDTDCNAANVGSVMGIICGLDGINKDYDYQTPFADRVLMPTAEGSRGTSDALREAYYIAAIGRRCMQWPEQPQQAWMHFSQRGAVHGLRSESEALAVRNDDLKLTLINQGDAAACASTPVLTRKESGGSGGYGVTGSPRLYSHYQVRTQVDAIADGCALRCFVRIAEHAGHVDQYMVYSDTCSQKGSLVLNIPDIGHAHVLDFGFELSGQGSVRISSVDYDAVPCAGFVDNQKLPRIEGMNIPAYVCDMDNVRGPFSDDKELQLRPIKSQGRGLMVTGTDDWQDYTLTARLNMHLSDYAGLLARYQGQRRCVELRQQGNRLLLIEHCRGEHILAECESRAWAVDEFHHLQLTCCGREITAYLDGEERLRAESTLAHGGAGFCFANGIIGVREFAVAAPSASMTNAEQSLALKA